MRRGAAQLLTEPLATAVALSRRPARGVEPSISLPVVTPAACGEAAAGGGAASDTTHATYTSYWKPPEARVRAETRCALGVGRVALASTRPARARPAHPRPAAA